MKKIFSKLLLLWKFLFLLFFLFIVYRVDIKNDMYVSIGMSNAYTKGVNKALLLDLNGHIKESPLLEGHYLCDKNSTFSLVNRVSCNDISLFHLVALINQAKYDHSITGIILFLDRFTGGNHVALESLGKVLNDFKKSGKFIYAVGNSYTQNQYFIASYANKIYIIHHGIIHLHGLHIVNLYYKDFLDKFKFKIHILRQGEYKSAVEPFLRNNMSSKVKKSSSLILQNIWDEYVNTIAINRHIPNIQMHKYLNNYKDNWYKELYTDDIAQYAYRNCLVDYVLSKEEITKDMINIFGLDKETKLFNYISIYQYALNHKKYSSYLNDMYKIYLQKNYLTNIINSNNVNKKITNFTQVKDTIAIIVLNTTLFNLHIYDKSTKEGSNLLFIINSICNAALDKNNKGLVLYVNSPGGDYFTSKVIYNILLYYKSFHKPIVVVMGGIAASGGYYIASAADYIYASKYTITGSIGIYAIYYTIHSIWDILGIHEDHVSNKGYTSPSITGDLSNQLKDIFLPSLHRNYLNFWKLVLRARYKNINFNDIDQVTNGSIYTGYMARDFGLVDEIGHLNSAIYKVAALSKLKFFQIHWYTYEYNKSQKLFSKWDILDLLHISNYINMYNKLKEFFNYFLIKLFINDINHNSQLLNQYYFNKDKYIYLLCDYCHIQNN